MNLTVFGATGGIGREVLTRPTTPATTSPHTPAPAPSAPATSAAPASPTPTSPPFLLDQTTDARFHRAAPAISN
jgi:hypothetical protein